MEEAVRYRVLHETSYDYGSNVSLSQQQLHLSPRVLDWQQVEEQRIDIKPGVMPLITRSPGWLFIHRTTRC